MVLKSSIYKNICSILSSNDKTYKTSQNVVLFSRIISTYPAKNIYCLTAHRIISFIERNVYSIELMLDIMKDESEDEEIISTIEMLNKNPSISTMSEITHLCVILSDYLKWSGILKVKNSFIKSLDMINEDEPENMKEQINQIYHIATDICAAYNTANVTAVQHQFDTRDPEAMKNVVAATKDMRDPNRVIITGIKGLNALLSPGYIPGQLYVFQAVPGNYKSGMLLESHVDTCRFNAHIKETINGKIPISMYISMENSIGQTVRRLWSILYPTADFATYSVDEIVDMINKALTSKGFQSVILYYGYREKSTKDIADIIRSYNDDKHEVVALYFDYIKRVRPGSTDVSALASEKSELNAIMNEFKLMSIQFNIPIITAHQMNRLAQQAIESVIASGGYNKTDQALQRSGTGSAWEVVEVADWLCVLNIENHPDNKMLVIKALKQRDLDSNANVSIIGIRHPFISPESFALKLDITENVPLSIPIYNGTQHTNYMANV